MGIFITNKKAPLESVLQKEVINFLEKNMKASVVKLMSTNKSGWPDLWVGLPNKIQTFIETKRFEHSRIRRNQMLRIKELNKKGFQVIVLGKVTFIFLPYLKYINVAGIDKTYQYCRERNLISVTNCDWKKVLEILKESSNENI